MASVLSRTFTSVCLIVVGCFAGRPTASSDADDYARAERFLAPAVNALVVGGSVTANWLADDRFWYRNAIDGGAEFILVDPIKKTRARAFNHEKVAAALSTATATKVEPWNLDIQALTPSADGTSIAFNRAGRRWSCDVEGNKCAT